jgi:predicted DNA-binding transcriptional regulator AlpA
MLGCNGSPLNTQLIAAPGTPNPIERPLTAQQLAEIVPLHHVTILRWAREGRIPHRRLSARKIVFLPSEINTWLSSGAQFYTEGVGHAAQPERMAA